MSVACDLRSPLRPGVPPFCDGLWQHAQALARTAALMTDERLPAIFEGAFEYDGIRIRVDGLERLANGAWGLREVKSTARPKDNHYDDIAIQLHVLNGSGIKAALTAIDPTGKRAGWLASGRLSPRLQPLAATPPRR